MGFDQNIKDLCQYIKKKSLIYITIYVDHMVIAGETHKAIQLIKDQPESRFHMINMGRLHHIIGIRVKNVGNGEISLSQEHYIKTLLKSLR